MYYRIVFPDDSTMDLRTLMNDKDDRPSRGITVDGVPVIIGTFKYIAVYPDAGEVVNERSTKWLGF